MTDVKVLTFVCNWCSYGGADHAGGLKRSYPAGIRLVRVMCSGRVDPQMVLQSFRRGADGVLILGCHPGDCHYKRGNYVALQRAVVLTPLLRQLGISPDRFSVNWVSSGEGERFCRVTTEMYQAVAKLGPLHLQDHRAPEVQP